MNKKKAGKKKKSQHHKLDYRRRMETFYRTSPRNRKKENCIRRKRTNFRHREGIILMEMENQIRKLKKKKAAGEDVKNA